VIVTKIQFYAIELSRNREGHNDQIRHNFKPKIRNAKPKDPSPGLSAENPQQKLTREVEAELQMILTGDHALLKE
jgi:hypothetical protein